jgi:hypothetical protein
MYVRGNVSLQVVLVLYSLIINRGKRQVFFVAHSYFFTLYIFWIWRWSKMSIVLLATDSIFSFGRCNSTRTDLVPEIEDVGIVVIGRVWFSGINCSWGSSTLKIRADRLEKSQTHTTCHRHRFLRCARKLSPEGRQACEVSNTIRTVLYYRFLVVRAKTLA